MLSFLRIYGPLDDANAYVGSDRAGYDVKPGAGRETGVLSKPIDMHTLLDENFWDGILFEEAFDMQATMFQPVGGMDRIPYAFAKALGDTVRFNSPVTEIRKTAKGVRIGYRQGGVAKDDRGRLLRLRHAALDPEEDPQRLQRALQKGDHRVQLRWRLQDCMGEPPLLGEGLQHLWRAGISQHRMQPGVVSFRRLFSERGVLVSGYNWDAGSGVWRAQS